MIADPYKVFGISPNASDAELKKAYRELSKKWHPDENPNNQKMAEEKFKEVQEAYRQIVDAREKGTSPYGTSSSYGNSGYGYGGSGYGGSGYGSSGSGGSGYGNSGGQYDQSRDGDYQDDRGYADFGGFGNFGDFFNQWQQYSNGRRQQESEDESNEMRAARNYINSGYYQEAVNALNQTAEENRTARWYYYAAMANQGSGNNMTAMSYAKRAVDMEPGNQQYANLLRQLQTGGSWYQQKNESYGGFGSMGTTGWCLSMCALNLLCNCCASGGRYF